MQDVETEQTDGIGAEIRELLYVLWDGWPTILLTLIAVLVAVLAYIWMSTVLYTSQVEILIDPRSRQTVETEVTPTGLGSSAAGADTLLLESQVEILNSQGILDQLIRSENLTEDPEFGGEGATGPLRWVRNAFEAVVYGPQARNLSARSSYDRTVRNLRDSMGIGRQRNTYVIRATMQSEDPEKAARLANAMARIYIADVNTASATSTGEAATALDTKLDELRKSVGETAAAVEAYRTKNNLIGTSNSLVVEQQLQDLTREASRAQLEVETTQARLNQLKAVVSTDIAPSERLPDLAESAVVSDLQSRLAVEESALAELAITYADRHPILRRSKLRKEALEAALKREFKRIIDRLEVRYKSAVEKEKALQTALTALKSDVATSNSDSVQLRELEREANSVRAVYEGFLRRSKEAREQVDLPSSTARIISAAYPSSRPSDPPVFLLLFGGLVFGLGLGVVITFVRHTLFGEYEYEYEDEDDVEYG